MAEKIRCEVFRILRPDWSSVTEEKREEIWRAIRQGVEDGEPPKRKGFVGVRCLDDVIVGFFAHEDLRMGVQYDRDWTKKEHRREEFEHLFFALVMDQGQVILQRKRVDREFVTINLNVMRRAFFELLRMVFAGAGFDKDRIIHEPFQETRDKTEMLHIFEEHQVTYIRVKGLLGDC